MGYVYSGGDGGEVGERVGERWGFGRDWESYIGKGGVWVRDWCVGSGIVSGDIEGVGWGIIQWVGVHTWGRWIMTNKY